MSNNMDDIEILCRHLSEKLDVKIKFEKDATPCTNGKEIILPTNLNKDVLFEMLGTLLHETFHLRYTDFDFFQNTYNTRSELMRDVVNVLEDIRIDHLAMIRYPQSAELYYMLYKYAMDKHKDALMSEGLPWRILKHMILKSGCGNLFKDFYYDEEALKLVDTLGLDEYIQKAKDAHNISQLYPYADEVIKKLSNYVKEEIKKPQPQGSMPGAPNNMGGAGNQAENQKKQQEKSNEQQEKLNQLRKQIDEVRNNYWVKAEERKKADTSVKTARTTINKKEHQLKNPSAFQLDEEEIEKLEKSLEKAKDKLDNEKLPKAVSAQDEARRLRDLENKLSKEYNKENQELALIQRNLNSILTEPEGDTNMMGIKSKVDISGFSAIDKGDILVKPLSYDTNLTVEKTLDQQLREFFVDKREERQADEDGRRLNRNRLSNLFTTGQNLFTEQQEVNDRTDIIFLLDRSGSMMHEHRGDILVTSLSTLMNSLNRVVEEENLPVETAVYMFDDTVEIIKGFDDQLTVGLIADKYSCLGGTAILKAVNQMHDVFQAKGDNAKRVLVVFTDAEVGDYEMKELRNQVFDDMRVVYVGMDCYFRCKEAREMFEAGNIKTKEEVIEVLSRVISQ